jgi:SAM-dependent methyltransferase
MQTKTDKKKKSKGADTSVNVNLGCGIKVVPGWINIDNFYFPESKDFIQGDVRAIPLESGTVDYLLCDNVLEHIEMADIPVVLHEIRRVLKVGGRAVIIVPDFRDALNQWAKYDHDKNFNAHIYKYVSEVIYGNQIHDGEFHKTPMSPGFLNYSLLMCGFKKFRMIFHPIFGDAPDYPGCASAGQKLRQAEIVADIIKTS